MKKVAAALLIQLSILALNFLAHAQSNVLSSFGIEPVGRSWKERPAASNFVASDLFISEYIEGTSNNKAIEIYNGTGGPVNLGTGNYVLQVYFNGSPNPTSFNLDGVVPNNDVYVVARNDAAPGITSQMDVATPLIANFNGDDAVVLRKGGENGAILDAIGQIGTDPGTRWGTEPNTTMDHTMVRKNTICVGDTNGSDAFDPATEWNVLAVDTFTNLGSHSSLCGAVPPVVTSNLAGFTGDFGSVLVGSSSAEQIYTVSGTNIGAGGIVVTAPAGFEVSPLSGFGFGPTFTIGGTGTIPATQVFVRFRPSAAGAASGNVANAATGASVVNVPVSGIGVLPDTTPPETSILTHPSDPSTSSSAQFTFSGTDEVGGSGIAGFECSLDAAAFGACSSPANYSDLADGSHTFAVRSIDAAGNTDPTPSSFTWTINTTPTTVEFEVSQYAFAEASTATVRVRRVGSDLSGTSTVSYSTVADGTATGAADCDHAGSDYISASGTLSFAPTETLKTVDITLCGDRVTENPSESFGLELSSPSNAVIATPGTATVTILDAATQFVSPQAVSIIGDSAAAPYGTTINVTGYPGPIGGIRVTLFGVTHPNPDSIEALLVSPNGTAFVMMADAGGSGPLTNATITLEDVGTAYLPDDAPGIVSGVNYHPAACGTTGPFESPAPAAFVSPGCGPSGPSMSSVFGGVAGDGIWTLYVRDDGAAAIGAPVGQIDGWGIQILIPTAAQAEISGRVRAENGVGIRNATITVSGGDLTRPFTTATNAFGNYRITGLTAGHAYILTVSSPRYTFEQPVRAVQLFDSIAGFDFVASEQ